MPSYHHYSCLLLYVAMCAHRPESQPYRGLHPKQCGQQVEGGDSAPLLCSGETLPGVLRPALKPSAQERQGPVGACPKEGHEDDQRAGASLLQRHAERLGVVQPGEQKAPGKPYCSLPVPEGAYKKVREGRFTRLCSDRTRGNGFKLIEGRLKLAIRKEFFTVRVVKHWHRLPREAVDAPSLDLFKARLDEALSNLI